MPFLGLLIGRGRPANWLLRNKWNSLEAVQHIHDTPLLLFSSLQVSGSSDSGLATAPADSCERADMAVAQLRYGKAVQPGKDGSLHAMSLGTLQS